METKGAACLFVAAASPARRRGGRRVPSSLAHPVAHRPLSSIRPAGLGLPRSSNRPIGGALRTEACHWRRAGTGRCRCRRMCRRRQRGEERLRCGAGTARRRPLPRPFPTHAAAKAAAVALLRCHRAAPARCC
ncbi:hypothetical protein GQ55_7G177800 [Panicum hallii var. hallii]|uniref:Uncharacterized protein n=1 Tax=Panicum hallii var. hallii TaxID=1504633 RepID=A0A2T7CW77_9POAL|nr:hypothetical protein GQ55_7G177800 [Panicum hallii var. hallii]